MIKKIPKELKIILSIVAIVLTACFIGGMLDISTEDVVDVIAEDAHPNGVPIYFLEPEGHIIANVHLKNSNVLNDELYGYISNEDYEAYMNGTFEGILKINHPYEEGKFVTANIKDIQYIEFNEYLDLR